MSEAGERRCGFVTVLGPTNAGKSTLVNALVGTKVAIVSHKVQTTRAPIRGIAVEGQSQIVFLDTAGIFNPKRRLDRAMIDAAWSGLEDADAVLLVIDAAAGPDEDVMRIVERLKTARMRRIAVLNKIDRVEDKPQLLALAKRLDQELPSIGSSWSRRWKAKALPIFDRIWRERFPWGRGTTRKTT